MAKISKEDAEAFAAEEESRAERMQKEFEEREDDFGDGADTVSNFDRNLRIVK